VILFKIHSQTKEFFQKIKKKWILNNGITKKVIPMVYYVLLGCGVSYK